MPKNRHADTTRVLMVEGKTIAIRHMNQENRHAHKMQNEIIAAYCHKVHKNEAKILTRTNHTVRDQKSK